VSIVIVANPLPVEVTDGSGRSQAGRQKESGEIGAGFHESVLLADKWVLPTLPCIRRRNAFSSGPLLWI
jgi:hypothetical protein